MSQFISSIKEVKKNYNVYDEWEKKQANEKAQKAYLSKTLDVPKDKVELTEAKAKAVIRAAELLDNRSENNCQNMEQLTGIASAFAIVGATFGINFLTMKQMTKGSKHSKLLPFLAPVATLATAIGFILWGNSKQKEASRIGRFQAKQNELKDVKNFVIYTPEQIAKAVEKAKDMPIGKDRNTITEMISETKQVFKDKKAYQEWQKTKDPEMLAKLKEMTYTPEQIKQGEEDKELIVDAVKDINIKAEEYSENTENLFDTMNSVSWLAAIPLGMGVNKILKSVKSFPAKFRPLASTASGLFLGLGITLWGTAEKKNASRIGRFQARQELMKNPASLMAYSKEDMEKAKDVKSNHQKVGFLKDIAQDFKFLPKYLKDKKDYVNYKEKTQKQNENIIKVLREEADVSEKQMDDAKHLREKVFTAFDEVDEMSQRYSEDVEAGTEIAKELGMATWTFGTIGAIAGATVLALKGKLPIHRIIKGISSISLDSNSSIKKAIDKVCDAVKGDKELKKKLNYAIVHGKLGSLSDNPKIGEPLTELINELSGTAVNGIAGGEKGLKEAMESHFKKGRIAKWFRSLTAQSMKLWANNKIEGEVWRTLPQEVRDSMKFGYKNYNTLINTAGIAAAPALAMIIGLPYAFNAWLTNIQKKAGKIGIMKAMEKIDDPKVFVNQNASAAKSPAAAPKSALTEQPAMATSVETPQNSNMLYKFKQV